MVLNTINNIMDFIISYHLQNKLKKSSITDDELKELKEEEERFPIRLACSRCGQNPYLCQCDYHGDSQQHCEKYSPTKYRFNDSTIFNPEKDNY